MELLQITNIMVEENPSPFLAPFKFKISMKSSEPIQEEIEWQIIYVGCASDDKYDQILDKFTMGPFDQACEFDFQIQTQAPNHTLQPSKNDILGITALILACSYSKYEFFRCGYYVYNSYTDQNLIDNDTPDAPVLIDKVEKNVFADQPRITRFNIWQEVMERKLKLEELRRQIQIDNFNKNGANQANPQIVPSMFQNQNNNLINNFNMMQEMKNHFNPTYNDPFAHSNGIFEQLSNNNCFQNQNYDCAQVQTNEPNFTQEGIINLQNQQQQQYQKNNTNQQQNNFANINFGVSQQQSGNNGGVPYQQMPYGNQCNPGYNPIEQNKMINQNQFNF